MRLRLKRRSGCCKFLKQFTSALAYEPPTVPRAANWLADAECLQGSTSGMGQSRQFGCAPALPVCPNKQTFSVSVGMFRSC